MRYHFAFLSTIALLAGWAAPSWAQTSTATGVTRATLDNGLRVVIVRDPLAPVATVEDNYLVGGNETPAGFPGMAHAQEHMAFRGCTGLTADQISAIYAQLGGYMNADTQQNITQYFVTVPAKDLDVALRVDASCMAEVEDSQDQWAQERGAIEQEVSRDLSNPIYKFITRLNHDLFPGTPYQQDALGTKESFDKTTGEMLKKFYTPVVRAQQRDSGRHRRCGSGRRRSPKSSSITGPFRGAPVPPHPAIESEARRRRFLRARQQSALSADPDSRFRFPGTDSPDFAAARILSDVLSSQRADLYALVPAGQSARHPIRLARNISESQCRFRAARRFPPERIRPLSTPR